MTGLCCVCCNKFSAQCWLCEGSREGMVEGGKKERKEWIRSKERLDEKEKQIFCLFVFLHVNKTGLHWYVLHVT